MTNETSLLATILNYMSQSDENLDGTNSPSNATDDIIGHGFD